MPALRASRVDLNEVLKEGGRGGERRAPARPQRAAGGRGGALDGAAGRRRADDARLPARAEQPAGLRHRAAADRRHPARRHEVLRQDAAGHEPGDAAGRGLLRPGARAGARAARASRGPASSAGCRCRSGPIPSPSSAGPRPSRASEPQADFNEVDAQALDTLGIRLLRGRGIEERDVASAPWVAVVNKTFADRHFPGQDPIGQAIRLSIGTRAARARSRSRSRGRSSGVVADVTYPSFFNETPAAVYIPFRQHVWQYGARGRVDPHAQGAGGARPRSTRSRLVRADRGRGGRRSTATRRRTTS